MNCSKEHPRKRESETERVRKISNMLDKVAFYAHNRGLKHLPLDLAPVTECLRTLRISNLPNSALFHRVPAGKQGEYISGPTVQILMDIIEYAEIAYRRSLRGESL